jgi:dTDP-glucose 4,6-dehydratase
MNILIAGGMGFIGSNHIIHTLNTTKHNITNIDKLGTGSNPSNLKQYESHPNYRFTKDDITNRDSITKILETIDLVVNFAAETHVDRSIKNPYPFIQSNYIGTYNLLEAERNADHDIKHIQVSTDEVYGDISEGSHTENNTLEPSNPYSATKAAADLLCKAYTRTYGLNTMITRCTNNYGPRQFPEKLIPKTIIRAINNLQIPIYGTGENIRDWLYVTDHCTAINHLIEHGKQGETYNISARNEISVLDIVHQILDHLEKPDTLLTHVQDRPGHDVRYSLDSTKLRNLGWKPTHNFNDSLEKTVNWYKKNQDWWQPLATEQVLSPKPWEK